MEKLRFNKETTPMEIIESLRQKAFDPDYYGSLDGYLDFLMKSLWKFHKIGLQVPNGSIEYKCSTVVDQLILNGFIEMVV